MITVLWEGKFVSPGRKPHTSSLSFTADTMEEINSQIREFIECMEDGQGCWDLQSGAITKVSYDPPKEVYLESQRRNRN